MRLCYAKSYIKEAYYIEYNKIINRGKLYIFHKKVINYFTY